MNRLRLRTDQDFLKAWVVSKRVPFPACSQVGKGDAFVGVIDAPQKSRYRKLRSGLRISKRDSDHMSATYSGIDGYVGNTPLIRLRRLSELTGCEILGKAEFMNPAGSVKDRAAYGIITDAEAVGRLKPGATIVEGTAGNTGIGLAVIGRARGYRTVIVIPNNQSPEKMHLLRTLGAEVKAVPEKPYKDPENYNHIARRLADERGWFWPNQLDTTPTRHASTVTSAA